MGRGDGQNIEICATDATGFDLNQHIGGLVQGGNRALFVVEPAFSFKNRDNHRLHDERYSFKMASIPDNSSAVKREFFWTPTMSSICSGRLAPIKAEVTSGWRRT